jgi:hypothetical protein
MTGYLYKKLIKIHAWKKMTDHPHCSWPKAIGQLHDKHDLEMKKRKG